MSDTRIATLTLAEYDDLKLKADFFNSEYIAMRCTFKESWNPDGTQMWVKDEVLKEIEDSHKKELEEYKERIRSRNTLKFWKWRLTLKTVR